MQEHHSEGPFNAVPPVVLLLVAAIIVPEAIFQLGARGILGDAAAAGWRIEAFNAMAFLPQQFDRAVETGDWRLRDIARLLSYSFVHMGFAHVAFVCVFVLALGKMAGEVFHPLGVLAVFFGSAIMGAVVYAVALDDPMALIGGFPAAYGMIGAYTFLLWTGLGAMGMNRIRAFQLIGVLMGIQLVFGLLFGTGNSWVAELTGFVTGFLLSFLVSPGGFARMRQMLRHR